MRFEPDGKHARSWLDPRDRGGVLTGESRIGAAPDGKLVVYGDHGLLRRFDADGRLEFMSRASASR